MKRILKYYVAVCILVLIVSFSVVGCGKVRITYGNVETTKEGPYRVFGITSYSVITYIKNGKLAEISSGKVVFDEEIKDPNLCNITIVNGVGHITNYIVK